MWLAYTHLISVFTEKKFRKSTFYIRLLVGQSQAVFLSSLQISKFQTGIRPVTKFCQHQVNACNYFTWRNFNKNFEFWSFLQRFVLAQNECEILNYLELYILDFLSNTRILVFIKSTEISLSIFTMYSDLLTKRIKLKF